MLFKKSLPFLACASIVFGTSASKAQLHELEAQVSVQANSQKHYQKGGASWYGGFFHGRLTANGERYDIAKLTAAHKKLPFGTRVLVTNVKNKKSVIVKINDRGPFVGKRIIDLSPAAFRRIGKLRQGVMQVKLTVLS